MSYDKQSNDLERGNITKLSGDTLEGLSVVEICPMKGAQNAGIIAAMGLENAPTPDTPTNTISPELEIPS